MWAICLAYLVPRFALIDDTYHIVTALTNPFRNIEQAVKQYPPGLPGRQLAASAARALAFGMWGIALLGALRMVRRGRRVLPLLALAFSPMLVVFAHSYGGEAVYRAYLFSLPWTACLAAGCVAPRATPVSRVTWLVPFVALASTVSLLVPAVFGMDLVYVMPTAEVRASEYFYRHAEPGGILMGTPNFPTRLSGRYDGFALNPNGTDPTFLDVRMWGRMLDIGDVTIIENKLRNFGSEETTTGYVLLSRSQANATSMYGILPRGAFASLRQALLDSPDFEVFYRNADTTIFRFREPLTPREDAGAG
jgi:hypothetical protein